MFRRSSVARSTRLLQRLGVLCVLLGLSTTALGARCVEHSVVRTDEAGNTYLLGEIFNDTDVQGSEMTFRATLFDAQHAVMAWKDIQIQCPGDLAAHSQIAYGVKFDEPNLPAPASFEVKPIAGKALAEPPPAPGLSVAGASANWESGSREKVFVKLAVRNDGDSTLTPQMCAVAYDAAGTVRSISPFDPKTRHENTTLHPGDTLAYDFELVGQQGAATVRAWLWFPGSAPGTSSYQPLMTEALGIAY